MTQLKASVVIDLAGNLQRRARQYESTINSFARSGSRSMTALRASTQLAGRALDNVGNRFVALATGGAIVAAGKQVTDFSARLNQLGIDASLNGAELAAFREQARRDIAEYAKAWGVNRDEIVASMEDIISKTGDLDYANKVLQTNAQVIRASNAAGADIGRVAAEFQKMGLTPEKANEAWDILLKQGKFGAFTVRDMASLSPRIFAARPVSSLQEIRETGALMQTLMMSAGSPEQATTSFEALMRELNDPQTLKRLRKSRISVMQPGTNDLLPLPEIIRNIVQGTGGDRVKLADIIRSEEATRGLTRLLAEYKKTGNIKSFDELLTITGDGSQLIRDAKDNLREAKYQLVRMTETAKEFADLKLAKPVDELAAAINNLPVGKLDSLVSKLMIGGAVVGTAGTAWLGAKFLAKFRGTGAGTASSAATQAASAAIKSPYASYLNPGVKPPGTAWGGVAAKGLGLAGLLYSLDIPGSYRVARDSLTDRFQRLTDPQYRARAQAADAERMEALFGARRDSGERVLKIEITGDAADRARVTARGQDLDVTQSGAVMGTR